MQPKVCAMGRKSKLTDEKVVIILREADAGARTGDLCRRHGIKEETFNRWRANYGGLSVDETHRLKQVEEESTKRKKLAETTLDKEMLKTALAIEWWSPRRGARSWAGSKRSAASASVGRAGLTPIEYAGASTRQVRTQISD
jgi:putative transposase